MKQLQNFYEMSPDAPGEDPDTEPIATFSGNDLANELQSEELPDTNEVLPDEKAVFQNIADKLRDARDMSRTSILTAVSAGSTATAAYPTFTEAPPWLRGAVIGIVAAAAGLSTITGTKASRRRREAEGIASEHGAQS